MSKYSYLSSLECSHCQAAYEADKLWNTCACGRPLLARYDLALLALHLRPHEVRSRPQTLWRYHELLPVSDPAAVVSFGEAMTPLLPLPALSAQAGFGDLWLKDESSLPTGSFKARGAAVGLSRARELGVTRIAMPTNGNAGAAWSSYAARAGIEASIIMPADAPEMTRRECVVTGAHVGIVPGSIKDAGRVVQGLVSGNGFFDTSTLKEPYRLEGKKTMILEILEQNGWKVPDVLIYPTGGGVGIIGIHKALIELQELGWIAPRLPRLVSVQATGCAPIVDAFNDDKAESTEWPAPKTVAFGISVPKALGDFLVLKALRDSGGTALAVDDAEILAAQHRLAQLEGVFCCPEGAAALAAAVRLRDSGWLTGDEQVVILNTGTGLKYPDTVPIVTDTVAGRDVATVRIRTP